MLTVLHAGGKFGGGGYKVSGGLHGVGVSVVNALSQKLDVEVRREGHCWAQSYTLGVPDAPLQMLGATDESGTTITFWPSTEIFETTDFSFETLSNRLREMAFLNRGLTIVLRDERPNASEASAHDEIAEAHDVAPTEVVYRYDGGLVDYVNYLGSRKDPVHRTVVSFEAESEYIDGAIVSRRRNAMEQRLHRVRAHVRQHHQHARGRHARRRLSRGAHDAGQQVRPRLEHHQGEGHQPHRRRRP